ncbi:MAG: hypothetical protein KAY22_06695 [Rhizorhabdus sp.]|uniref:hypothetical protein n=1 Tax=Rhizorhabdus sp. TaxID=1968843 RepID=UPI001B5DC772|nr:hypothetical protein [Rhizorhabdus sp.]MBP8231977.1 hypothetical protein [Rhizorhabdus sp.]
MRYFIDGAMKAVPAVVDATYGDPLLPTDRVAVGTGIIFYLAAGESVSFTVATKQPDAGSPAVVSTLTGPNRYDEPLGPKSNIFVTAISGAPKYRQI